ncbi:hypothetical protein AWC30_15225 [Mycolicibacillus trivialis]|uniref:Uncharacterized protein n=2 Tax=Mycolicibacillus trivialis TaxID=1798 RepID=A0A1X2EG22_9MYCO|nr:hypothetical protein AWC30_15225 [Mycolicibacillus trivialis]
MSRRMAAVGVHIPAERLVEIAAGCPASTAEITDIRFAATAAQLRHELRRARQERWHRRTVRWFLVAGLTVAALNALACLGYLLFSTLGSVAGF